MSDGIGKIDYSKVNVDDRGRVSFSGISSGIDSKKAVDGIIKAKRIPIDRIEKTIEAGKEHITALEELKSLTKKLKETVGKLRGALSADKSSDVFSNKRGSVKSTRNDGAAPTAGNVLLGATISNSALEGSHTFEILQRAEAHKISSNKQTAGEDPQKITGTFQLSIEGKSLGLEIDLAASDTLYDIRDKINTANRGTKPSGVTASVITVGKGKSVLILTADDAGHKIKFKQNTGTPLNDLGILSGTNFTRELTQPAMARIRVDNLVKDVRTYNNWDSASPAAVVGTGQILTLNNAENGGQTKVTIPAGTSLQQAVALLNGQKVGDDTVKAEMVRQASGNYRIELALENDYGEAVDMELLGGFNAVNTEELLTVERDSNTISDVLKGVTFDLFRAEPGTEIELEIDADLLAAKTAIVNFVEAYNGVRGFLNQQKELDPATKKPVEEAKLYGERVVGDVESQLSWLLSQGAEAVGNDAYATLSQIGIDYVTHQDAENNSKIGMLEIDDIKLDQAFLNNFDKVEKLFSFGHSSTNAHFSVIGFNSDTRASLSGIEITVTGDGKGNIDTKKSSVAGGNFTVDGNVITVTSGPGKGMQLYYSGDLTKKNSVKTNVSNSQGIGHNFFYGLEKMLDDKAGLLTQELETRKTQIETSQGRVDTQLKALEEKRALLEQQYNRMEQAMAALAAARKKVESVFASLNKN